MNKEQKSIIKHAQGNGKVGYCTSTSCPDMNQLVGDGIFQGPIGVGMVGKGGGIYHLTRKGRNWSENQHLDQSDLAVTR